ncbi:Trm112 family protein [Archangium sp.]|uniref:Trm112 family protein n=1 Tax=Archangium sp. TaxID=1872627 RepID=UPI0038D4B58E
MTLPEWLLQTLACPRCKGPLEAQSPLPLGEGQGEGTRAPSFPPESTTQTELHCATCRLAYPIRDGVPQLLPEESRPLPSVS